MSVPKKVFLKYLVYLNRYSTISFLTVRKDQTLSFRTYLLTIHNLLRIFDFLTGCAQFSTIGHIIFDRAPFGERREGGAAKWCKGGIANDNEEEEEESDRKEEVGDGAKRKGVVPSSKERPLCLAPNPVLIT